MVIDTFKWLCEEMAGDMRSHPSISDINVQKATDTVYAVRRARLIDLIVDLSLGGKVDWNELNATMKDWR